MQPPPESLFPHFWFPGRLNVSTQVDAASENAGVDLPSSDFSMSSTNWDWAGLEGGDVNTMSELPSAPGRDRTSSVLSRKATTITIIVGYIPCWWDSIPAGEPSRKHGLREVLQQTGQ